MNRAGPFAVAVGKLMGWLAEAGCSRNTVWEHERCYEMIGGWLDETGMPPCAESVAVWEREQIPLLKPGAQGGCRTAARRVAAVLETGEVPLGMRWHACPSRYKSLPAWAAASVDRYIEAASTRLAEASLGYERVCASHFMRFACARGARRPSDIGAGTVIAYWHLGGQSERTRRFRISAARGVLGDMHGHGEVTMLPLLLADPSYHRMAGCYEPFAGMPTDDATMGAEEYLPLADEFVSELASAGYADKTLDTAGRALRMLYVFLSVNGLGYGPALAGAWVESIAPELGSGFRSYRRPVLAFARWLEGGGLSVGVVFRQSPDPMAGLEPWAADALCGYIGLRRREGCEPSTLATTRAACVRFLEHAQGRGATGTGEIDAATVVGFCREDAAAHATPTAAALYVSKVRGFLEYLADEGAADARLPLSAAANADFAPRVRVVRVLSEAQVAALAEAIGSASTPLELRDAAMLALGLELGLRACDVVGMRVTDIDWRASTVTLVQRKTGVPVSLPLTPAAGNAIIAYARGGRPRCDVPELFLSLDGPAPGPLASTAACDAAAKRVLGEGATFHDLRRTFATNLLGAGGTREEVSEALGHRSELSSRPYLSLDEGRMRMCALSPTEMGIGGGVRGK